MKILQELSIAKIIKKKKAFRLRNVYRSIMFSDESIALLESCKKKYNLSYSQIVEFLVNNELSDLIRQDPDASGYLLDYEGKSLGEIGRRNRRTIRMDEGTLETLMQTKEATKISVSEIVDQLVKCIDLENE